MAETVAKRRIKALTLSSNVRVGLYGAAKVNPLLRLSELETLHARFIPDISIRAKDLMKGSSGGNVNKLYPDETKMSARQWKRESYTAIPKQFLKDFSLTAKEILQGTWKVQLKPPEPDTVQFWTEIFERESDEMDLNLPAPQRVLWDLVRPITEGKMRHCLKGVSGTAGLDGLTWVQVKKGMRPASLAAYYNNWLVQGRLPETLKEGYTTLIPKEVGTADKEKMRPLIVTSCLIQLFHRILNR